MPMRPIYAVGHSEPIGFQNTVDLQNIGLCLVCTRIANTDKVAGIPTSSQDAALIIGKQIFYLHAECIPLSLKRAIISKRLDGVPPE